MRQPEFNFSSEQLRDAGIAIAISHAEAVDPGWKERTWEIFTEEFLPTVNEFKMEDFRSFLAEKDSYAFPPKNQAFGFIAQRGVKKGMIEFSGYSRTVNPISHKRPITVWRKK